MNVALSANMQHTGILARLDLFLKAVAFIKMIIRMIEMKSSYQRLKEKLVAKDQAIADLERNIAILIRPEYDDTLDRMRVFKYWNHKFDMEKALLSSFKNSKEV